MTASVHAGDPYLTSILAPEQAALLVVDVQNDFCHAEGRMARLGMDLSTIQAAVTRLRDLLPVARRAGVQIIFVVMQHDAATNSPVWINRYPTARQDACVSGTWGAALYELTPAEGEPVVVKHRYSPFVGTNIQYLLRARATKTLLVTGVATNICVEAVLRDGFNHDYNVVLVEDCARSYSERGHQSTVENTRGFLGRVVQSHVLKEHWARLPVSSDRRLR